MQEGLARCEQDGTDGLVRDGLIQRFAFMYEQSVQALTAYLNEASATPGDYDAMGFSERIRSANEQGLLPSAALSDDFSESDLPWKVHGLDWATTSGSFRAIVERQRVLVQQTAAPAAA